MLAIPDCRTGAGSAAGSAGARTGAAESRARDTGLPQYARHHLARPVKAVTITGGNA